MRNKKMPSEDLHMEDLHLSDQALLLSADGELPTHRAAQVHAHLAACWSCRARMAEVEATIVDFARAHRQTLDPQLPPIEGPRALLRAQLAELVSKSPQSSWPWFSRPWLSQFSSSPRAAAFAGIAFFVALIVGWLLVHRSPSREASSGVVAFERGTIPDHSLTPGATRTVTIGDVCSMPHEKVVGEVSTQLREEVLQEYGIVDAHPDDYEIDYLITPGLGGAENIHNLWPEPSTARMWNSRVKDDLEERLHQMVCAGQIDLSTAQREIATDWITAYKKYFHTDRPLTLRSDLS
jgi:hypothetical protein